MIAHTTDGPGQKRSFQVSSAIRRAWSTLSEGVWRLFDNRRTPPRPSGNFVPNSNGNGGRVVGTGQGGAR